MNSFFGGKACTREACAIRSLKPETPTPARSKAPALQEKPASSSTGPKATQLKKSAPAVQRQRNGGYAAFSSLDDESAGPSAPPPRLPTAGERALAAVEAMERMKQQKAAARSRPRPPTPSPSPYVAAPHAAAAAAHSGRPSSRPAPSGVKVVHSRSKFGAAGRSTALPPQQMMKGLTERQKAGLVMERMSANASKHKAGQSQAIPASNSLQRPSSQPSSGVGRALPSSGRLGSDGGQLPRLKRGREPDLDDEYDSDFVESDEEGGEDWRSQLRSLTRYDPGKYGPVGDDRRMVASAREIEAEERRSKKLGAAEDRAEEERQAQRAAAKKSRTEETRRKKKGAAAFLD